MTDLTTLLQEGAPVPQQPLDVDALLQRARRPSGRRLMAWLGGLGAVVGLAIPVGGALLAPADRRATEIVTGPEISPASTTPTPTTASQGATPRTSRSGDSSQVAGTSLPDLGARSQPALISATTTAARAPGASLSTSTTTTTSLAAAAPASEYPAAHSCVVNDTGLASGEQRRCRFAAQGKGGASLRSSGPANAAGNGAKGEVLITRGKQTTRQDVAFQRSDAGDLAVFACGGPDIQAGDLVEIILTAGNDPGDSTTMTLGAGEGWECYGSGGTSG